MCIGAEMSWKEIGIVDPNIRWNGPYTDLNQNSFENLYLDSVVEIEIYQDELDNLCDLGLWLNKIEEFKDWIDYIEMIIDDSSDNIDFREKFLESRFELLKFRKEFEEFENMINYIGE